MVSAIALLFSFGASVFSMAHAQDAQTPISNAYYKVTTLTLSDGNTIEKATINGPPQPPSGFEIERQTVMLPESDSAAGIHVLTVMLSM